MSGGTPFRQMLLNPEVSHIQASDRKAPVDSGPAHAGCAGLHEDPVEDKLHELARSFGDVSVLVSCFAHLLSLHRSSLFVSSCLVMSWRPKSHVLLCSPTPRKGAIRCYDQATLTQAERWLLQKRSRISGCWNRTDCPSRSPMQAIQLGSANQIFNPPP